MCKKNTYRFFLHIGKNVERVRAEPGVGNELGKNLGGVLAVEGFILGEGCKFLKLIFGVHLFKLS